MRINNIYRAVSGLWKQKPPRLARRIFEGVGQHICTMDSDYLQVLWINYPKNESIECNTTLWLADMLPPELSADRCGVDPAPNFQFKITVETIPLENI